MNTDLNATLEAMRWETPMELGRLISDLIEAAKTRDEALMVMSACSLWLAGKAADGARETYSANYASQLYGEEVQERVRKGDAYRLALAVLSGIYSSQHARKNDERSAKREVRLWTEKTRACSDDARDDEN